MSIDGLPPLREVIARHGLQAKKALGQNFLLDLNLTGKIARAAGDLDGMHRDRGRPRPRRPDPRAARSRRAPASSPSSATSAAWPRWPKYRDHYPGRLDVDRRRRAEDRFCRACRGGEPAQIVANLPYNIGTELLVRWLTVADWPPFYAIADADVPARGRRAHRRRRPAATPMAGSACWPAGAREARIAFDVPPQAFTPPPKVTSSVVHLVPRADARCPPTCSKLGRVTEAAFGQRRKMLRQSLKGLGGEALLDSAGIDPTRRAETLSVEEFVRLANAARF